MDPEIYDSSVGAHVLFWSLTNWLVRNANLAIPARRRGDRKDLPVKSSSDLRGNYARTPNSKMRYA
jgi:hypothetical protein